MADKSRSTRQGLMRSAACFVALPLPWQTSCERLGEVRAMSSPYVQACRSDRLVQYFFTTTVYSRVLFVRGWAREKQVFRQLQFQLTFDAYTLVKKCCTNRSLLQSCTVEPGRWTCFCTTRRKLICSDWWLQEWVYSLVCGKVQYIYTPYKDTVPTGYPALYSTSTIMFS